MGYNSASTSFGQRSNPRHRSYFRSDYDTSRTGRNKRTAFKQPLINHIAFVIDASSSMQHHRASVVKVVEGQVAYLARRSVELGQETRVSVYVFADGIECLVFDVDVLRLPKIGDLYDPYGNTALIGATLKALADLKQTAETYGDHSYFLQVVTDGEENASFDENDLRYETDAVKSQIGGLADNWTVVGYVPDQRAMREAIAFGFPKDNLAIWDTTSDQGASEMGQVAMAATESYLVGRSQGVRGTRTAFSTGADVVNQKTVAALKPLPVSDYKIIPVVPRPGVVAVEKVTKKGTTKVYPPIRVDEYVRDDCGLPFQLGHVYYEWSKAELIQPQKRLAIVAKNGEVFVGTGDEIRTMIGLPVLNKKFAPDVNKDYSIFVQSTAPNRHLVAHSRILVMQ